MKRNPKGTWMKLRSSEILRAFMRQRDFSMSRLARYAGCSKSMISHLCAGRKTTCTEDLASRIAEALDIPIEALFVRKASAVSGRDMTPQRMSA
jgi:transcriptional regulator with XRE-family HTH domain